MARAGRPPQDPARRLERAHEILDAAAELILRWGYDKTTIDDVAKRAGVAKGTIYLHWKTRDELFAALLRRERVLLLEEIRAGAPATVSELFGRFAGTALRRPLLRAVLLGDSEVLGKLTRMKRHSTTGLELGGAFGDYIGRLIKHGAVREEPGDHVMVITSIVYGFVHLPDMLPDEARLSDDRIAELVADTVERAMSTGRSLPAEDARAVARATLDFLDAMEEVARGKLAVSLGTAKERVR
ncbi:TetR family transcriptional regulator [Nonomuraea phyllanthi]|uniref:TetR family transcriptional regulator n=1 Tax=Nonomuraea phyllanthi TaxID=2219224 RepID=A0A5C4WQK6_9ACTN|nr:TetR/AcrR family transcriptional regulator [Nonomuraea phyllanthi]KAB8195885.1 TetR family transcriptional regulator [Nonomuraea phyllanthi]QFY07341.1 TetR family transcriptional regulator [Nonomuraea phyllanthi]